MQEFQLRRYTEKDIRGVLGLFSISFDKEVSEAWFRWKYQKSPFGAEGYVVADTEKIVAFYGGIKLPFNFKGRTLWAYQFCDVMTHPEYRGKFVGKRPLVVRLGEMFYNENPMDFAFGFPSLRHARLQSLRLGGKGYRLVRLYKKERLKKNIMPWKLRVKEGWDILEKGGIDEFLAGRDDESLRLAKDDEYIRWRYLENPSRKYSLLVFKRLNITKGYVIFTAEDDWVNILEIFSKRSNALGGILVSLEAYISGNMDNVKGIKAWFHPEEPFIKQIDIYGYKFEDNIPLAFKPVNSNSGVTSDIFYDRYFYRMGDYDAS
jgi:hypothetical protein